MIQAIGQIIVIIDEGDRAFGGGDGDGDGGTSSRVIGRIKEFMSDTENRGRVLFILMTNRPDKLDIDIKRAGRLDRKIPFLYPQTGEEVINILRAQFKKNKVKAELDFDAREALAESIVGYSNADIEAIVMLAERLLGRRRRCADDDLPRAMKDYLPSRDVQMLEYMELLAVFEASNRRMLPKKYADVSRRRAAGAAAAAEGAGRIATLERAGRGQKETDMADFFPEVHLSHGAAEAIARGLYAIARVDGLHEREAGLIASFWIDAGGGGPLSDLERAESIKPADVAAALHSDAERQLFIKTAILLDLGRRRRSRRPRRRRCSEFAAALGVDDATLEKLDAGVKDFLLGQLVHVQNSDAVSSVAKKLKV